MTAVEPPMNDNDWTYTIPYTHGGSPGEWAGEVLDPEMERTDPSRIASDIEQRILRTIKLVEERGYGLTLRKLSKGLIGGPIGIDHIRRAVAASDKFSFDGAFVCVPGSGNVFKCHDRRKSNRTLGPVYLKIAKEYVSELSRLCPWVECIMLSGSAASGGIALGDDLDFDIVTKDGTKFITYLLALALGLKYSIKNKTLFKDRYFGFLPKVVCVNVVWEKRQVLPFVRQDEQMAYELMISKVMFNQRFHAKMIRRNLWLKDYFPQLLDRTLQDPDLVEHRERIASVKRPRIMNIVASKLLQSLYQIIKLSRKNELEKLRRMEFVEAKKRPYGLFDE